MIRIGHECNTFLVNTNRINKVMVNQHIEINANFEDIQVFTMALSHEHVHMVLNEIVDRSCEVSLMLDNIDQFQDNYPISG